LHLHEIETGAVVFIDANIFVYHFSKDSVFKDSCTKFLLRVENAEIHGVASAAVVMEAAHRLMMVEASAAIDVEIKNLLRYLKQHPEEVKKLTQHLIVPEKIEELNISIEPVTNALIKQSQNNKTKYGLLSNDALSIKIMESLGISLLASNDTDFKSVDWVTICTPVSKTS